MSEIDLESTVVQAVPDTSASDRLALALASVRSVIQLLTGCQTLLGPELAELHILDDVRLATDILTRVADVVTDEG